MIKYTASTRRPIDANTDKNVPLECNEREEIYMLVET